MARARLRWVSKFTTPALVAPIEFTMRLDDYARLGGHVERVVPVAEAIERRAIETAFRRLGGNISAMSRELGIGRTALYRKLKQYAADPVTPRTGALPREF